MYQTAYAIQHTPSNIQHNKYSIHRLSCTMQHALCAMRHTPYNIHHPQCNMHDTRCPTQLSPTQARKLASTCTQMSTCPHTTTASPPSDRMAALLAETFFGRSEGGAKHHQEGNVAALLRWRLARSGQARSRRVRARAVAATSLFHGHERPRGGAGQQGIRNRRTTV